MTEELNLKYFRNGLLSVNLIICGLFALLVYLNFQRHANIVLGSLKPPYPAPRRERKTQHFLTLFTTWVHNERTSRVQNMTILNWSRFRPEVKFVVYTNDVKVTSLLHGLQDWYARKVPSTLTPRKIPVLKYMYIETMKHFDSKFYSFVNSDMLFTHNLIDTIKYLDLFLNVSSTPLLLVGKRINVLGINKRESTSDLQLAHAAKTRGISMPSHAADYFISNKLFPWMYIPDIVIGAPRYDNWLMQLSRKEAIVGIDVSQTVLAVHHSLTTKHYLSRYRPFSDFNIKLLEVMFGVSSFPDGKTDCLRLLTKYAEDRKTVVLVNRTRYKDYCRG